MTTLIDPAVDLVRWRDIFDDRMRREIAFGREYVDKYNHGTDGHIRLYLIGYMAQLLDYAARQVEANGEGDLLLARNHADLVTTIRKYQTIGQTPDAAIDALAAARDQAQARADLLAAQIGQLESEAAALRDQAGDVVAAVLAAAAGGDILVAAQQARALSAVLDDGRFGLQLLELLQQAADVVASAVGDVGDVVVIASDGSRLVDHSAVLRDLALRLAPFCKAWTVGNA